MNTVMFDSGVLRAVKGNKIYNVRTADTVSYHGDEEVLSVQYGSTVQRVGCAKSVYDAVVEFLSS